MPELPFNLLDFKRMTLFTPFYKVYEAAAGDAINETNVYSPPDHTFAWLRGVSIISVKATATEAQVFTRHKNNLGDRYLIKDNLGTGEPQSWPSAKATTLHMLSWYPLFMFPTERIQFTHALTIAETIVDRMIIDRIEYRDPRFE